MNGEYSYDPTGETPAGIEPDPSAYWDPYANAPQETTEALYYTTYYEPGVEMTPGTNPSDMSSPDGDTYSANTHFGVTLGGISEVASAAYKNIAGWFLTPRVKDSREAGAHGSQFTAPSGIARFPTTGPMSGMNMIMLLAIGGGAFLLFRGR